MVSLAEDGRYLSHNMEPSSSNGQDTDVLIETSRIGAEEELGYRTISTPPVIGILAFLVLAIEVCMFVVPVVCEGEACGAPSLSTLLYAHGGLWFFIMLGDRYLRHQYNAIRTYGYLEFYRQTRNMRRIPFMVYSGGNAFLLVVMTILNDYCNSAGACSQMKFSQTNYLQLTHTLEAAVVLPVYVLLLVRTVQFNRSQMSPDVNQDDMMNTYLQSHAHSLDVGFRDEDFVDDVLEKQADLIRYLKQHNSSLGRKVLELTAQAQQKERKV